MSKQPEKRSANGFEEWGGYMSAKRAKLNVQFNESSGNGCESELFTGVSININGHVNPTNLRSIFLQHGGTYESFATSSTDFVIAENLSEATKRKWGSRTVRPEWIMESITAGKKLDHRKYLLYDFNQENRQLTLAEAFKGNSEVSSNQVMDISTSPKKAVDECASNEKGSPKKDRRLQAWEDGFLEEFWNHSRLHCISSMKRTLQQHVAKLKRSASTHDFPELKRYQELVFENNNCSSSNSSTTFDTVLFLVDLDCFFVSVGRLTRPEMVNRPVAVTHFTGSKNITSSSDIACASYEARKYGVRNGMYVSMAKELCPELEVIPYDFEAYQRISMIFCNVVTGLTLDVEPGSIDELLMDVTPVLNKVNGSSPVSLAEFLRRRIFEETKCTASVGIGKNRLLAKLASKKAKPDGVHIIDDSSLSDCLENQPLRDLTGVGYSMMQTLEQHHPQVKTCGQMQQVKLEELKNLFGAKKGETLYNACRGIDDSKLSFDFERPKSISIDVNYGIRLTEKWQFEKLLTNICKAISKRAQEVEAVGTKVTVKILTQMQGAPEPSKSGGHGWCDEMTKTLPLMNPTRNNLVIFKGIQSALSNFTVPVEKYRGVSVQLTGLKFDFDGGKRGIQPTLLTSLTKMPVATVSRPPESAPQEMPAEAQRKVDLKSKKPVSTFSNIKLDESVLRALPEGILKETLELYGFSSIEEAVAANSTDPVPSTSRAACLQLNGLNGAQHDDEEKSLGGTSELSKSFMAELPDDIRAEFQAEWDQVMKPVDPQLCMPIIAASPKKQTPTEVKQTKIRPVEVKADEGMTATTAWVNQRVVPIKPKENTSSVPFNRINWWHYDGKDKLPTERNPEGFVLVSSSSPAEDMSTWELNGKTEISEIRNAIRDRVYALPNPDKEHLDGLIKFFERLISGHRIKKVQILMRFLSRFSEDPNITAKWSKICKLVIFTCQSKIQRSFGVPLQLHNIEDDAIV